jgi:hypothetical protein
VESGVLHLPKGHEKAHLGPTPIDRRRFRVWKLEPLGKAYDDITVAIFIAANFGTSSTYHSTTLGVSKSDNCAPEA